jgi:4-hydroxybenzoate polyprenyltransferase
LAESRGQRGKGGNPNSAPRKEPVSDLIPANPLSVREALLQVVLLLGIPLVLLLLARFLLRQFFPSLGY